jgi:hypothetical protein
MEGQRTDSSELNLRDRCCECGRCLEMAHGYIQ